METAIFDHYKKLFKGKENCVFRKTIFKDWDYKLTSTTKDKAISIDLISDTLIQ